ncbi:MAG: tRNA guanosine(34) transglycosylase Tgt, partial [Candidatus Yanofskybacteria bacterium]|nr:tRNA guanosine(34) transglycosylase Tgt [Candidatus Yanofskybacteria bacterium]
ARAGIIKTDHGEIETPALVAVATQATVKTLTSDEAMACSCQMLICNTFHLHARPGEKIVKSAGGLHKFMNWPRPLMTDSGGYQVFSLGFGSDYNIGKILNEKQKLTVERGHQPSAVKITEDGVFFHSPMDGSKMFLGPRESIKIQEQLGADIIFAFDECPPPVASRDYTETSMKRTHRWAKLCLDNKKSKQALYGIVQGGKFRDLRLASARFISSLDFDGFGIGGELGFDKKKMFQMLNWVSGVLPVGKPRHLLGTGRIDDLKDIFRGGADTLDCIIPTQYARHGSAFYSGGRLDLNKKVFLKDRGPIDKDCTCSTCQNYTRSYISHLLRAKEITPLRLLTVHNLYFFNNYVARLREDIKNGRL